MLERLTKQPPITHCFITYRNAKPTGGWGDRGVWLILPGGQATFGQAMTRRNIAG